MWKKIAIAGAIGAAVLGSGAAALAATGSSTSPAPATTGTSAGTSTSTGTGKAHNATKGQALRIALKKFDEGQWTSQGTSGAVTHDAIKGKVAAVSATSITVTSADNTSETYAVATTTKVRVGKTLSSIGSVKTGDTVLVTGTKAGSTMTAVRILDAGQK
jgi:hypothetical protein